MFKRFAVVDHSFGWYSVLDLQTRAVVVNPNSGLSLHERDVADDLAERLNRESPEDLVAKFLVEGRSVWFRSRPLVNAFREAVIKEIAKGGGRKRKKGHTFRVEESPIHGFRLLRV
jgi:hypothetical protein